VAALRGDYDCVEPGLCDKVFGKLRQSHLLRCRSQGHLDSNPQNSPKVVPSAGDLRRPVVSELCEGNQWFVRDAAHTAGGGGSAG